MTYVFQTFFRYLMTILILAVWFGLVVMPGLRVDRSQTRRRDSCTTKGLAWTDAPIGVLAGGAPTAENHQLEGNMFSLPSARPRRRPPSVPRADGGRHRVVRRVHTPSHSPRDVRVDDASNAMRRARSPRHAGAQPMLGRSSVREAAPTASLPRRLSLATRPRPRAQTPRRRRGRRRRHSSV